MSTDAVNRVKSEISMMGPIAEQAMENLSKPLHVQFAMLAKGKSIDEGREAGRRFLAWLDKVEEQNAS